MHIPMYLPSSKNRKSSELALNFIIPIFLFLLFSILFYFRFILRKGSWITCRLPPLKACFAHDRETNIKLTLLILSNVLHLSSQADFDVGLALTS